jgi:hypothetical protein
MVESKGNGSAAILLANQFNGMSMDERTDRLSKFQPKKLLYEVPLAPTKVELLYDEERDLSMIKKAIIKSKLTDATTWEYAKEESEIHK